jgi:hypothetical protein
MAAKKTTSGVGSSRGASPTPAQRNALLATLEDRFTKHMGRHAGMDWKTVQSRLDSRPDALQTLYQMEQTGGEPDVVGRDAKTGAVIFCDCAAESPAGRRSLCFDRAALDARKENKPRGDSVGMAAEIGVDILTEAEYRELQALGEFDRKTSSWVSTPATVRSLGGALFCDRRYDQVFVYHNGAESYYAARGFRGRVVV